MRIQEIWRRVTATRYTRLLEAEVVRLRAENRAMLNSILGIAGVPPIPIQELDARDLCAAAMTNIVADGKVVENPQLKTATVGHPQAAAPLRRRSWQQINRTLEFESAKKDRPGSVGSGSNQAPKK
jgi:hypothetical protein